MTDGGILIGLCVCGHILFHHDDNSCNYFSALGLGDKPCECEGFVMRQADETREDEIQGRLDAATPAPWVAGKHGRIIGVAQVGSQTDAELIVNAPEDLVYLLGENEGLVDENADLANDNANLANENDNLRELIIDMEDES